MVPPKPIKMCCGHAPSMLEDDRTWVCGDCATTYRTNLANLFPNPNDLIGRFAVCGAHKLNPEHHHSKTPSSSKLAFFVYKGPESDFSKNACKNCSYNLVGHARIEVGNVNRCCEKFEPYGPFPYDDYYCGCNGWD
jgi:hypothetical protein